MTKIFQGSAVALCTPMNEDGSVNYEQYANLVEHTISGGVKALVVNGTTGEASTLKVEEEHELIKLAVKVNKGRVPIICGTGSNDTAHAIIESLAAKELGADALLVVTPYYNKSSQRGLIAHFNAIANAAKLPIILYNIPGRTGVNMAVDTVVELAKNPYIVGIKEASGNFDYVMQILSRMQGQDFAVYSGEDALILPMIAAGGDGVISVLSNVYPRETQLLCDLAFEGKREEAAKLSNAFNPVVKGLFADVNPIPVKAALKQKGICDEYYRLPLIATTDTVRNGLLKAMADFEAKGF